MKISVAPSENYDRTDTKRLMAELRQTGIEVEYGGPYGRRSLEDLPPALTFLVEAAVVGVAVGFLQQIGADGWSALKRVLQRAATTTLRGQHPSIVVRIETDHDVVTLRGFKPGLELSAQVDTAIARLQELGQAVDLWYVEDYGTWLTMEEVWAHKRQQSRRSNDN